jgi:hypothetical protein
LKLQNASIAEVTWKSGSKSCWKNVFTISAGKIIKFIFMHESNNSLYRDCIGFFAEESDTARVECPVAEESGCGGELSDREVKSVRIRI